MTFKNVPIPSGYEDAIRAMDEMERMKDFLDTTRRQYVLRMVKLLNWATHRGLSREQVLTAEGFTQLCRDYCAHLRDRGYQEGTVSSYLNAFCAFAEVNSLPAPVL